MTIKHTEWCVIISYFINIVGTRLVRANYIKVLGVLSWKSLVMKSLLRVDLFFGGLILLKLSLTRSFFYLRCFKFTTRTIIFLLKGLIFLLENSFLDLVSNIVSIICMTISDWRLNFKITLAWVFALSIGLNK